MKNWQDYATSSNSGPKSKSFYRPPQKTQANSIKTWFTINVILCVLCMVSLVFGTITALIQYNSETPYHSNIGSFVAYVEHIENGEVYYIKRDFSSMFFENIALTFTLPGILFSYIYLWLTGKYKIGEDLGAIVIGLFVTVPLGFMLIGNAIRALIFYRKHKKDKIQYIKQNLILAIIPPVFVITILINLILHHT